MATSFSLKDVFKRDIVRAVTIAFFLNLLLAYSVNGTLPDKQSLLVALSVMITAAYLFSEYFAADTFFSAAIGGALSYTAYNLLIILFKLSTMEVDFKGELSAAVLFGGITAIVYVLVRKK